MMRLNVGFKFSWQVLIVLVIPVLFSTHSIAADTDNSSLKIQDKKALTLGFFPIISTVALYKRFGPLAQYLSEELNRPVQLKTSKNFPTFFKRTSERAYDLVITAPHFAVKANDSKKYNIRTTLISNVQQLVITHKSSSISSIDQLSGKVVSTPPNKALMTKMGKDMFHQAGMINDRAPVYRAYNSHNAANEAVLAGKAVAAIASSNIVKKMIKKGGALKIIGKGLQFPNMATLIASDIDKETETLVINAFTNMKNSKKGRATLKKIGFPGYRRIEADEYEVVRPYL